MMFATPCKCVFSVVTAAFLLPAGSALAQTTAATAASTEFVLIGKVTGKKRSEEIPFVRVSAHQNKQIIAQAACDFDGNYHLIIPVAHLQNDTVQLEFSYIGFVKKIVPGIIVSETAAVNVKLETDPYYADD